MKATKNYMVWKMTNTFQYFHMASRMEKDDGLHQDFEHRSKDTKLHCQTQYYVLGENNT